VIRDTYMPELQQFPVMTPEGAKGTIFRRARFLDRDERSIVRLEDGREFEVNSSEVQVRPDGTFLLNSSPPRAPETAPNGGATHREAASSREQAAAREHMAAREQIAAREQMAAREQTSAREQEYHRAGPDGTVDVDVPVYSEEAGVERVPVNRLVETEPQTRQEGDVTIIPIIEEVLVVEKRLLLKEEIHIRRTRNQVRQPRRVVVDGPNIRVLDGQGNEVRS
jgi:stress response protein YsnF